MGAAREPCLSKTCIYIIIIIIKNILRHRKMNWKRLFGIMFFVGSVESFQIHSSIQYSSHGSLTVLRNTKGCNGVLSLRLAQQSRRDVVGNLLAAGFCASFGPKISHGAALSGADPEDKTRLIRAIQTISELEGEYKDPSKWPEIIKILSQVHADCLPKTYF